MQPSLGSPARYKSAPVVVSLGWARPTLALMTFIRRGSCGHIVPFARHVQDYVRAGLWVTTVAMVELILLRNEVIRSPMQRTWRSTWTVQLLLADLADLPDRDSFFVCQSADVSFPGEED
jgi:hypothetical protein